eukprot:scaffold62699_cov33-Phaeocystis_antarctica.AAC.1
MRTTGVSGPRYLAKRSASSVADMQMTLGAGAAGVAAASACRSRISRKSDCICRSCTSSST